MSRIKLSEFAERHGVTYRTAWNYWKAGMLEGVQTGSGTILVEPEFPEGRGKGRDSTYGYSLEEGSGVPKFRIESLPFPRSYFSVVRWSGSGNPRFTTGTFSDYFDIGPDRYMLSLCGGNESDPINSRCIIDRYNSEDKWGCDEDPFSGKVIVFDSFEQGVGTSVVSYDSLGQIEVPMIFVSSDIDESRIFISLLDACSKLHVGVGAETICLENGVCSESWKIKNEELIPRAVVCHPLNYRFCRNVLLPELGCGADLHLHTTSMCFKRDIYILPESSILGVMVSGVGEDEEPRIGMAIFRPRKVVKVVTEVIEGSSEISEQFDLSIRLV